MDKQPRYRDLVKYGRLNEIECPGVQYICYSPIYGAQAEYYIVDKNSPAISDEAKSYGIPLEDKPNLLLYSIYDHQSGKAIIDYEINRYRVLNKLPLSETDTLESCAVYAAELHPEYFGAILPPRVTPFGVTLRWRAMMNGVYLHETDRCELIVSVYPPYGEDDLSDYARQIGVSDQGCRFYTAKDACVPLFELVQLYDELSHTRMVRWRPLLAAVWKAHPNYLPAHDLQDSIGLKNFVRFTSYQEEKIVHLNAPQEAEYLCFYDKTQEESYVEAERLRAISIYDLDLDVRARNILTRAGYETVYDVVCAGPKRLRAARNAGRKTFEVIVKELDKADVDTSGWREWLEKKPR